MKRRLLSLVTIAAVSLPACTQSDADTGLAWRVDSVRSRSGAPTTGALAVGASLVLSDSSFTLSLGDASVVHDAEVVATPNGTTIRLDADEGAAREIEFVRIDAENLRAIPIGNSDDVRIGEWVLAVGAPLDLRTTVTSGIVSAIGRSLDIIRNELSVEDFIQVDAAINPGNSGGALVNLDGELIGVNTAIATRNRGFVGYGFAIPIDLAKKVMDDIIAHGEVRRAYLGVGLKTVSAAEADAFGLDRPRGVLIDLVMDGTPADKADFKRGDIVLKVNGEEVDRPNHLQSIIARKHPGDVAEFSIRRKDRDLTIKAKLGSIPKDDEEIVAAGSDSASKTERLGLTVSDLTSEVMEAFGLSEETKGVVVTRVSRGPGRSAGFARGDVIFAVRQRGLDVTIESVKDFESVMAELQSGRSAAFSVIRQSRSGEERYLFLTPRIPS